MGFRVGCPNFQFCDTPESLARELAVHLPGPIVVVGVGNPLRGDDGFGPAVVAELEPSDSLWLFDVRAVPESFLVPIVRCRARGVLFLDAADMGADPGRVALVAAEDLSEVDISTHAIALALVAEAIVRLAAETYSGELVCMLLGAQPMDLESADLLSPAVQRAVGLAVGGIREFSSRPPVSDVSGP